MLWNDNPTPSGMTRRHFMQHAAGASSLAGVSLAFGHSLRAHAEQLKKNNKSAILLWMGTLGTTVQIIGGILLVLILPGYALTTVAGSGLSDGETLTLTDGVNAPVTLEFDLGNGVSDGNVPILFHNAQSAADVARALDDAILFAFGRGVETLSLKREQNDTIPEPARASYTQGFIVSNGSIGDNSVLFGNDAGRDVDMVQLQLTSGQALTIDLTQDMSNLNPLFGGQIRLP